MAFLAARAIKTTRPTWVRILLSRPARLMPSMAASTHMGTMKITAQGRVKASYWAARTRKTKTTAKTKTIMPELPAAFC